MMHCGYFDTTRNQWRIQNLQTGGAKVERRRREYRGAEGAEGGGVDFRSKNVDF